ncbi:MAG: hypothetical protein MUO29_05105 [Desulfobacterales bacterium]|nr:hypothetical protein [Desulfobacterales bacterium]
MNLLFCLPGMKGGFFDLDRDNVNFQRLIAERTHHPVLTLTIDYVFDFLTACEKDLLVPDFQYSAAAMEEHKRILH